MLPVFKDEAGKRSAARSFLAGWLLNAVFYIWVADRHEPGILALISAIAVPLIMWAAGKGIATAIGPGFAGAVQAVANAKVFERRSSTDGTERTP
jgi:hypothetical protein